MEMARLLAIQVKPHNVTGVSTEEYTAVPMQGSGTFSVESVFQTAVPRSGGKVSETALVTIATFNFMLKLLSLC